MVALIVIQFIDSPHHRYRSLSQSLSRSLSQSLSQSLSRP